MSNQWGGSVDLGLKSGDRLLYLWESDFKLDAEDAFILSAGPAIYYRFSDTIHTRFEWKHDFISRVSERQASMRMAIALVLVLDSFFKQLLDYQAPSNIEASSRVSIASR